MRGFRSREGRIIEAGDVASIIEAFRRSFVDRDEATSLPLSTISNPDVLATLVNPFF